MLREDIQNGVRTQATRDTVLNEPESGHASTRIDSYGNIHVFPEGGSELQVSFCYELTATTTDDTADVELLIGGTTRLVLAENTACAFEFKTIAGRTNGLGETSSWYGYGEAKNIGGVVSTPVVSVNEISNPNSWDFDVTADDTNDVLGFYATGDVDETVLWKVWASVVSVIDIADTTRGVFGGGYDGGGNSNVMDYIIMSTTGNAVDFGDLTLARGALAACSSGTRGVFGGGDVGGSSKVLDYITIATTGNATVFGDLNIGFKNFAACASDT